MTVAATPPRFDYLGTGTLDTYGFPNLKITAATDLRVTQRDTSGVEMVLVYPTNFTVTGLNSPTGGTITLTAGNLPSGYALTIRWDKTPQQSTDLRNQGSFFAETHEEKFDELTRYVQAQRDVLIRSLHFPETDSVIEADTQLPSAIERALKALWFDSLGKPIVIAGVVDSVPVSVFMATVLDDTTAAAARTTLGAPASTGGALTNAVLTTSTVAADPATALGIASRQYVDAAEVQNPINNGNMEIWQRGTAIVGAGFGADRWLSMLTGAGAWTVNRSTNVPTVAQAGVLFNYSLEVDVTTADASLAATDIYAIRHRIEGYNWRHFAQRIVTVSFWVMSPKTGIHSVALANAGGDRSVVSEYTVSVADTWERKTVTFPASPSAGTWDYVNGVGASLYFSLAMGSNFTTASLNAWAVSGAVASTNQVNVMDNTANFFRLTGVKLELGSVATPIKFRPFQEELAMALRYYQKSFGYTVTPAQSAGSHDALHGIASKAGAVSNPMALQQRFRVPMRAAPTITTYSTGAATNHIWDDTASVAFTATTQTDTSSEGFALSATGNAATAVGDRITIHWSADAEL